MARVYKILMIALVFGFVSIQAKAQEEAKAERWKGEIPSKNFNLGTLIGIGEHDGYVGFLLMGSFATRVIEKGWVPDISNQVYLETEIGSLWIEGSPNFQYSLHLRWDFWMNETWGFYSLGGFSGIVTSIKFGRVWRTYLRFGAGAIRVLSKNLLLRIELSRDIIASGVSYQF